MVSLVASGTDTVVVIYRKRRNIAVLYVFSGRIWLRAFRDCLGRLKVSLLFPEIGSFRWSRDGGGGIWGVRA